MSGPAGEILDEINDFRGKKKAIIGSDERGRIDIFIFVEEKDKVYQIKLESIRPRLKGGFYGYQLAGVGDEICAGDDVIEEIMDRGLDFDEPEEILERASKINPESVIVVAPMISMYSEGDYDILSSPIPQDPNYKELLSKLPNRIDGMLNSDLESYLAKKRIGSSTYIA